MAGILSRNVKVGYKTSSSATSYTDIENVTSFPDLGAAPDKVEVTTLTNEYRTYIDGVKDCGSLEFELIFDNSSATSNYQSLKALEGSLVYWQVEFPDAVTASTGHGTQFQFTGYPTCIVNGKGISEALTFKLNINMNSDINVVNAN